MKIGRNQAVVVLWAEDQLSFTSRMLCPGKIREFSYGKTWAIWATLVRNGAFQVEVEDGKLVVVGVVQEALEKAHNILG